MDTLNILCKFVSTVVLFGVVLSSGGPPRVMRISKFQREHPAYDQHWNAMKDVPSTQLPLEHQTKSDAMQLYSISAKRIVKIQDKPGSETWDNDYILSVKTKKLGASGFSKKDNKFVTETVSYGRLKIRSEDNKRYLCAKTNGAIVFKEKADKNLKPRKRCLFHWEFTNQMHIKLSVEAGMKKRYYLSVKNNSIKFCEASETTELERSFIWLPAKSANNRSFSRRRIRGRAFDSFSLKKNCQKLLYCKSNKGNDAVKIATQKAKIRYLEDKLKSMKKEIMKLKLLQEEMEDTMST